MNTGFAEFSEESSEEPYSRALTESRTSSTSFFGCRLCVASLPLPLRCDLQRLVGPVSQSSCALCGPLSTSSSLSSLPICALQAALAAYLATDCAPRTTPIDGIRPTATVATPTGTAESASSGRPNCSLHRHALRRDEEEDKLLNEDQHFTHLASPEHLHALLGLSKSIAALLITTTQYLAWFSILTSQNQQITTITNERTLASFSQLVFNHLRPANVATFIELPTLRPLQCC